MSISRKELKGAVGDAAGDKGEGVKWEENETALRKASKDG